MHRTVCLIASKTWYLVFKGGIPHKNKSNILELYDLYYIQINELLSSYTKDYYPFFEAFMVFWYKPIKLV